MSLDISQHIQVRIEPAATCEKPCPKGGGGIFRIWCHHSWYIGVFAVYRYRAKDYIKKTTYT